MEGIVVAIGAFFARAEVVPTVGEADSVVVGKVQEKAQFGDSAREEFGKSLAALQPVIVVDGRVADVGKARTVHGAHQRQAQFAVSGQQGAQIVHALMDENKIVFHQPRGAKVAEQGNARRSIHQSGNLFVVHKALQRAARPKTETLDDDAMVKELGRKADIICRS